MNTFRDERAFRCIMGGMPFFYIYKLSIVVAQEEENLHETKMVVHIYINDKTKHVVDFMKERRRLRLK